MTESAPTREAVAKSPLDSFYRWDEIEIGVTVHLNPEMVDRLQAEVLQGNHSSPRVTDEIGGLLLGVTDLVRGRVQIVIEDFAPVTCSHRNGPAYALSGEDSAGFEAAFAAGSAEPARTVVGYYRSHNRSGLFLSPDDLRLIRRYFPGPDKVFLLVKTLPNRACTAGFFFWKDGELQTEFTNSEVPLIPIAFTPTDEHSPAGEPIAETLSAARAPAAEPWTFLPRLVRGIALAGIAAAATVALVRHPTHRPLEGAAALKVPIAIANGESHVSPAAPAASAGAKRSAEPTAGGAHARSELENRAAIPPDKEAQQPAPKPVSTAVAHESRHWLPPAPARVSEPSISALAPAAADVAPQLPGVQLPVSASPVTPAIPAPRADATVPVPQNAPTALKARTFIGPQAIHEATPAVPRGVAPRITTDVQVNVEVTIDASGRVTGARIASTKGAAAGLLTIEALKAAQLFRFRPALENGLAVPSTMVLTFRFQATK